MAELLALADDETRSMWEGLRLGYTESTGHPLLRAEIARLHEGLSADDVMVFAGAEEAIFCLMSTGLDSGDHVVVTWPGYQSLYEVARASARRSGCTCCARRMAGGSTSTGCSAHSTRRRGWWW